MVIESLKIKTKTNYFLELRKTTLYRLIRLFYWRRVSRTILYTLSSHFIFYKNFFLTIIFTSNITKAHLSK